jgi:fumarylacetoacetase
MVAHTPRAAARRVVARETQGVSGVDFTHDAQARSWVASAHGHADFPLQNLPLGVFEPRGAPARGGVAIGDQVLDLAAIAPLLQGPARAAAQLAGQPTLNDLLGSGRSALRALRQGVFALLADPRHQAAVTTALHAATDVTLKLPVSVGDYTDFYTGIRHAENVGRLFRPDNPLLPNYKHVPIGYHGRASSVCASGGTVLRPRGQLPDAAGGAPRFAPSQRLDYELEMGLWIGAGNELGQPVSIAAASEHMAGLCLLNDWSARDIQAWEYQPLGPFLAKSFHTTVSPWIVTLDALEPYRIPLPARPAGDPAPLPYLSDARDQQAGAFAIELEVALRTAQMRAAGEVAVRLSRTRMDVMYWTVAQLVAHHTSNGCNLRAGDLLGTGTLSGSSPESVGSLLELTRGGKQPIALPNGEQRTFLQDGDEVVMTARAAAAGQVGIGFGTCVARVAGADSAAA